MELWSRRISSRIGERKSGKELLGGGRWQLKMLIWTTRMNVHLAEDGTVRHVDFK